MKTRPHVLSPSFVALISGVAGALLVLLVATSLKATADSTQDNVLRQIPYSGTLDFNGAPVTLKGGSAPFFKFDLKNGLGDDSAVVYSQIVQTDVYNGAFTAMLGEFGTAGNATIGIDEAIAQADSLYLQITILGVNNSNAPELEAQYGYHNPDDPDASSSDDVVLGNPQRLLMSPFTLWASNSTNFDVSDTLTVAKTLEVGSVEEGTGVRVYQPDRTNRKDLQTTHDATVGGDLLLGNDLDIAGSAAMRTDLGQLKLNPDNAFSGGVVLDGILGLGDGGVPGTLEATGDMTLGESMFGGDEALIFGDDDIEEDHGFRFGNAMMVVNNIATEQFAIKTASGDTLLAVDHDSLLTTLPGGLNVQSTVVNATDNVLTFRGDVFTLDASSVYVTGSGPVTFDGDLSVTQAMQFDSDYHMNVKYPRDTNEDRNPDSDPDIGDPDDFNSVSPGTSVELMSSDDGICMLSDVKVSKVSSDSDSAGCEVFHQNETWYIQAVSTGSSTGVGSRCRATCLTWKELGN